VWLGELLGAEATAVTGGSLSVVIGGVVVAAVGALGLVAQEWIRSRRTGADSGHPRDLGERVAVLEDWRVQTMKVDDIHDRQVARALGDVEDLVRWMDRERPGWRP
jgi:hypothetical protein